MVEMSTTDFIQMLDQRYGKNGKDEKQKERLWADPALKKIWCPDCKDWHQNPNYDSNADQRTCNGCGDSGEDVVFPDSWPSCPNCGEPNES